MAIQLDPSSYIRPPSMEASLIPFEAVDGLPAKRVVVLAPHPDDEVFGCGGTLARMALAGTAIRVIVVTDGAARADDANATRAQREAESREAATVLGLPEPVFWRLPDRGLRYGEGLVERISTAMTEWQADLVLAPSALEAHPDHYALALAASEAIRRQPNGRAVAFYEVGTPLRPNRLVNIGPVLDKKRAAMACFRSELAFQPYDEHIAALNRFRAYTLPKEVVAAEAFLLIDGSTLAYDWLAVFAPEARFCKPGSRTIKPGQETPLVGILIRSMDRATLDEALDCAALQTWGNLEIVVVAACPDHRPLPDHWRGTPLRFLPTDSPLSRPAAANAALAAARGKYCLFLDDDDLIAPDHVFTLAERLIANGRCRAAYAGVRLIDHEGKTLHVYNQPFSPERLMLTNYLPIHGVLFARSLVEAGCHFDESLAAYEDWDFWLQLSRHTAFMHVDSVSAVYRAALGESGLGLALDEGLRQEGRQQLFGKWLHLWSGLDMDHLAQYVLAETENQRQQDAATRTLRGELDEIVRSRDEMIRSHDETIRSRDETIRSRDVTIAAMLASTSWRITAPLRATKAGIQRFVRISSALARMIRQHGGGLKGLFSLAEHVLRAVRGHGLVYTLRMGMRLLSPAARVWQPPISMRRGHCMPLQAHQGPVDIVVCIHNALEDVKKCLDSVLGATTTPYRLILVDDGSAPETQSWLRDFASTRDVLLIRNEAASGYTLAANQGLRSSSAPFVVLLNSDTVVSAEWLDRLIRCAISDEKIAMVGPLSNTASWQSIPDIEDHGDWATNPLPSDASIPRMAQILAEDSACIYPRLPLLNGFCLLLKRSTIETIGLFDEETFASGYGEENDYCLRLIKAGQQVAVADDVYVYHAQSRSYSHERRQQLGNIAAEKLAGKHGIDFIDACVRECRHDRAMGGLRARARHLVERSRVTEEGRRRHQGRRVLFLLPTMHAGGGANVIVNEALAMRKMGVEAAIANLAANRDAYTLNYGSLDLPVHFLEHPNELPELASRYDAVVASIYYTTDWLEPITRLPRSPVLGYYVQDYEPYFFRKNSSEYEKARRSYNRIPGLRPFCKTEWNRSTVLAETGVECSVVGASVDMATFRPYQRQIRDQVHISAMIRPSSPYRAPEVTLAVLSEIKHRFGDQCSIHLFGCDADDPWMSVQNPDFDFTHWGKLTPQQTAIILNEGDIFVDFSTYQAMGLTAMEAAASGNALIVPRKGGATTFAQDGKNALVIDTADRTACVEGLARLVIDNELRQRLAGQALCDIQRFYPEAAASKILDVLFEDV